MDNYNDVHHGVDFIHQQLWLSFFKILLLICMLVHLWSKHRYIGQTRSFSRRRGKRFTEIRNILNLLTSNLKISRRQTKKLYGTSVKSKTTDILINDIATGKFWRHNYKIRSDSFHEKFPEVVSQLVNFM